MIAKKLSFIELLRFIDSFRNKPRKQIHIF